MESKPSKKKFNTRIPFYDILANPDYKSKFEYESVISHKEIAEKVVEDFSLNIIKKFSGL